MSKAHVLPGIDRIETVDAKLRGRRIGLMTNPTGISRDLASTVDILHERYGLSALFACEHGIRGDMQAGDKIATQTDADTGATVYSAYGGNERFNDEMLSAFDVFVFDMQDVGSRFYTYLYSLAYAMQACARAGKLVVVLDRINPIGGEKRGGVPILPQFNSFVGNYGLPAQYGLTIGEFALYVKDFLRLDLELTVVKMTGWRRALYLDETDLPWVAPSPNCPTLASALCFTANCLFEGTNLSEGRGTTTPFELIGAPWLDAKALEREMNAMNLPGVRFRRAAFRPTFSKHAGALCLGVQMHITDREAYRAFEMGLFLLETIWRLHPDTLEFTQFPESPSPTIDRIMGTDEFRKGELDAKALIAKYALQVEAFGERVKPFLLYD